MRLRNRKSKQCACTSSQNNKRKDRQEKNIKRKKKTESKKSQELYYCDFYQYSRKASIANTQNNRAIITLEKLRNIVKKSEKEYTTILSAINKATNNGTTCSEAEMDNNSTQKYKILRDTCNTANIMAKCNPAQITLLTPETFALLNSCQPKMKDFNKRFKVCPDLYMNWYLINSIYRTASSLTLTTIIKGFVEHWSS